MSEPLPDAAITAAAHSERRVIMRLRDWADEITDAAGDVVFSSTAYETVLAVLRKARDDGAVAAAPALRAQGAATERARIREHLVGVVTRYASSGNDSLLGALLDAIRELVPAEPWHVPDVRLADLLDGAP